MMDTEDPKEDGELEDGEITSDEEDHGVVAPTNSEEPEADALEAVDYILNERPISWATRVKKQAQSLSSTGDSGRQYQPPLRPTRPEPPTFIDDDENSDGSVSSEEDSDEDGPMGKKTRRMGDTRSSMNFKAPMHEASSSRTHNQQEFSWSASNPFDPSASSEGNDAFKNQATVFQQKRKTNNIWSAVLQDEEVSDIFGKVKVQEGNEWDVLIDRGPESFSIKYDKRPPLRRRSDSSSLSSGGLTDNELEFLRSNPDKPTEDASTSKVSNNDEDDDYKLPKKFGSRNLKRRRNPQARCRKLTKKKMIRKMKKMNPVILGEYMAKKLTERKHNLLVKAITLLGKEPCISLFLKTMKIERRGGLLIRNQERRRTPGGVFLYLLRGDRRFTKSMVDKIFEEERHFQTKDKKKEYSRKRLRRKAKLEMMEAAKLESAAEAEPTEEKCDDEVAFQVNQECMEEESDAGSLIDDTNESEVDSDDYYRIQEADNQALNSTHVDTSRGLVSYEGEDDCLNLHCDSSDIVYK